MEKLNVGVKTSLPENYEQLKLEAKDYLENFSLEERVQIKVDMMNSREGYENLVDSVTCSICLNKGLVYYAKNGNESFRECECMKPRKVVRELKQSGLYYEFKNRTFDNFKTDENFQKVIKENAIKFVENENDNWFVVLGQSGSGKTHICTAISEVLIRRGKSFKYFPYARDIFRLQNGLKSFHLSTKEDAEYEMWQYRNADVLYIDDFLKVKTKDSIFELIDYRYSNNLTTIISSELSLNQMMDYDVAIAGRIVEKSGPFLMTIKNDPKRNYRMKGNEI